MAAADAAQREGVDAVIQALRARVDAWRGWPLLGAAQAWTAPGAYEPTRADERPLTETSRALLRHWFRSGVHDLPQGRFRYWPHQRRAVETFIYVHEVCGLRGRGAVCAALGLPAQMPKVDPWAKLGGQLATGAGKTKVMSLLIAWSVLNALREGAGPLGMGPQALLIAPNLFVKDRLLADFRPERGGAIFDTDPVLPLQLRQDWRLPVYDAESCPRALGPNEPALIVTNIHQLYTWPEASPPPPQGPEAADQLLLFGPNPKKLEAEGTTLTERLRRGPGMLVLNDEAHHVGDEPAHQRYEALASKKRAAGAEQREELAWIGALRQLHQRVGLGLQVDLSATLYEEPGDAQGKGKGKGKGKSEALDLDAPAPPPPAPFLHTVVEYGLSAAIHDGVVKQPVLELPRVRRGGAELEVVETEAAEVGVEDDLPLIDEDAANAWDRYKALIIPGIFRWKRLMDEERRIAGDKRPRKPLLFLLCADRAEADEIANFLQYGEVFAKKSNEELVGRPLVGFQHPQLGEAPLFVSTGPDGQPRSEVIQVHIGEQEMNTEEGWKRTRDLVNAVDQDQIEVRGPDGAVHTVDNPITVIVSVMMLKEGWDVRNVKVIVPLRSCASRTLTEQSLGRGLRRMNRPEMADDGAVDGSVKDELYVLRHPSFERVIREINDLVEQRTSAQINEGGEPQFAPVPVQPEAALREAHAVSWVRVEGMREVEVRWHDSFKVEQLPRGAKLPWRDQFDSRLIETTLEQDGVQRPGERIEVGAKLAYHTYNRLLDQLYVEPLSKRLQAGRSHLTALRSVVKDTLEKRTFALPAGLPLSLDGAVASEDGWIAIANLVRPEIREHVVSLLLAPLREAMAGPRTAREPVLREERSDQRAGYTARAEHLVKGLKRSSFTAAAVDNADEQRVVAMLERCPDVVAWVHNHRSGLGWFLPYEVNGEPHRYYPDFVARVALQPSEPIVVHNVILEMKGRMDALDAAKAAAGAQHAQTLSEAMQEPWQYLLLREDDRAGITDLSWWEGQSAPTFAGLLRHVEPIGDAAGLGFRLLTDRAIDGAVLRGVDEAGWLSGDALRGLGGRSSGNGPALPSADPDRLLLRAEALVAAGQLRRSLRAPADGADDEAPGKLAELLARLERGEALSPEELALQVGYRHGEGRA